MKAFLEHDGSGLLYEQGGQQVSNSRKMLTFPAKENPDNFPEARYSETAHTVSRLDPRLIARLSSRPPGIFQSGE